MGIDKKTVRKKGISIGLLIISLFVKKILFSSQNKEKNVTEIIDQAAHNQMKIPLNKLP